LDFVDDQYNDALIHANDEALQTQQHSYRYAGFWMRFWAYLFDIIVIFGVNSFILSPFKFINNGLPIDIWFWTWNGIIAGFIYYIYFLLMTKFFGQTVGKMILGLKVIHHKDGKLTWMDLFFREVIGRLIYNVFFLLKPLYFIIGFTNEKQGLHDMIGNTRVIHEA